MQVGLSTSMPVVYGVLNCLNEDQVKARSSADNNHGYDWGKTAVEMALLRNQALNIQTAEMPKLETMGFGKEDQLKKKEKPGFF
jgi:6,7-dimethyl-8-ribityllumazine synthase